MKKGLRISLAVIVALLTFGFLLIPIIWDVSWIDGWPQFIGHASSFAIFMPLLWLLVWPLWPDWKEKKRKSYITIAIFIPVMIAFSALLNFNRQTTNEYLHSPGRSHTVVITVKEWDDGSYAQANPVLARIFYGYEQGFVTWSPEVAKCTYAWIDDNTLEFILADMRTGEVTKEYIRW
ncbi:MAG: hypothetical protein FWC27_00690 [Firmicutes bacterium]|nr:hypothetical protein [Bacillota bacterium]